MQAAARGEAGTVRLAYTLTTVYDTVPMVLTTLNQTLPQVKIDAREVFGGDLISLFDAERCDIALAPKTTYPPGIRQQPVRHVPFRIAVGEHHPLADRAHIQLSELSDERFESGPGRWPPGITTPSRKRATPPASNRTVTSRPPARPSGATSPTAEGSDWWSARSSISSHAACDSWTSSHRHRVATITAVRARRNDHPAIDRLVDIMTRLAGDRGWI